MIPVDLPFQLYRSLLLGLYIIWEKVLNYWEWREGINKNEYTKIPVMEIENSTLKFIWKHKRPQIAKTMLSKKSNAGGITMPDFKLCYSTIAIKTAWYWHKNRQEDQQNRVKDPDMNPCSFSDLIFDKGIQNI
jgi:hypothetical protein